MNDDNSPTWGQEPLEDSLQPPSGEVAVETETPPVEGEEQVSLGGEAPSKKSADARINELIAETKRLNERLTEYDKKVPMPPVSPQTTPELQKAVENLKKVGRFVDEDALDNKVKQIEDRMVLNAEHSHLEGVYGGSDGRPKYDRRTVEDYMRTHGYFEPEAAYKMMYEPELLDWNLKQTSLKKRPYTAPPSGPSTGGEETLSREKIAEMQKSPNWKGWYEKNREKILLLMAQGQL